MKIDKRSGSDERKILTGMIIDPVVCARICSRWEPGLFQTSWANTVAEWCFDFHKRYGRPPGADIESLFEAWADEDGDDDTVKLVDKFLDGLSQDYEALAETINSSYVTDLASDHFNQNKLRKLTDTVTGFLDSGNLHKALSKVNTYGHVEMGSGSGCDVLTDEAAILNAMTASSECLIKYPQALGPFFQDALTRDALVAIQAPEKRGKTFWLIDIAWRGMLQKRKVAFFSVGDMSEGQMIKRLAIRATKQPLKPKKVKIPTSLMHEPGESRCDVDYRVKVYKDELTGERVADVFKEIQDHKLCTGESCLRLSTHPNSSIGVRGIDSILQQWEREGWTADVVVIDYADILAMPDGGTEVRNQINETWKQLRALSQSRHCLVVTATQADAASYEAEIMNMSNFSEDKRKFAHVTGMFGLNQTASEKDLGVYRLNWIVLRESEFDTSKVVHVAGCLALASPAIKSVY